MGADLASETGVKSAARSYQVGATSASLVGCNARAQQRTIKPLNDKFAVGATASLAKLAASSNSCVTHMHGGDQVFHCTYH